MKNKLPQFKKLLSEKDYAELYQVFASNRSGLDHIDKHVYVKMFKYKDV